MGVAAAALLALVSWLGSSSARFQTTEQPFVARFVSDLSQHWALEDVSDRLSDSFVQQANSRAGQRLFAQCRVLGPLSSISDPQLQRFMVSNSTSTGVFSMRAQFKHGGARIQITLVKHDNTVRVLGFSLYRLDSTPDPTLPQTET